MKKFLRNKKAGVMDLELKPFLIMLVFILLVMIPLLIFVQNLSNKFDFEKEFLAKDFGLFLEVIHASPLNLIVEYHKPKLMNFTFSMKENTVIVTSLQHKIPPKGYDIIKDNMHEIYFDEVIELENKPVRIPVMKSGDRIIVAKEAGGNMLRLYCGQTPSKFTGKIALSPGHLTTTEDFGFEYITHKESDITLRITQQIFALSKQKKDILHPFLVRDRSPVTIRDRLKIINNNNEIAGIISIHTGQNEAQFISDHVNINNLRIFVNKNSENAEISSQLACNILNSISGEIYQIISGISVIPIDPKDYPPEHSLRILDHNKIGLLFEIGNIKLADTPITMYDSTVNLIAESILDSITKMTR